MRVPSGDLCCVILIDLVGCDCSCDGGRLTGVRNSYALWLHAAYCHAGDMRCDFLVTGEMHIGYMQCKHMLAPRGMIL